MGTGEEIMEHDKGLVEKLKKQNLTVFEDIYLVKFELVAGCNLKCDFCGISTSEHGHMTPETFTNAVKGLPGTTKRVDFIMHGEPTLNKHIYEFANIIRIKFPKCQLTLLTNMEGFKKKGFDAFLELYRSGINMIQADLYNEETFLWAQKELASNKQEVDNLGIRVLDYYKDNINPFSFKGNKRFLICVPDYQLRNAGDVCTRDFHTFGGNIPHEKWESYSDLSLSDFPMDKVCTEPLKYLPITYNGDVTICCRDGAKTMHMGNVNETPANDIWQGREFQMVRLLLKNGYRKYLLPCVLCNFRSFRIGLNPYWGKEYTMTEIEETLPKIQRLNKKEPLYQNLLKLEQIVELPSNIKVMLSDMLPRMKIELAFGTK